MVFYLNIGHYNKVSILIKAFKLYYNNYNKIIIKQLSTIYI